MKLNCDLGESFGAWKMGNDEQIMPHIHQANIACGFHAGDPNVMKATLILAKQYHVEIGAHPSYPDKEGFGRRSMSLTAKELTNMLQYQVAALAGMANSLGLSVHYVKPHGALYNDMMKSPEIMETVFNAVHDMAIKTVMVQSLPDNSVAERLAKQCRVALYFEAFADRQYQDNGLLVPRAMVGAVLDPTMALQQVSDLYEQSEVDTAAGSRLPLSADSVCVHGDSPDAVSAVQQIRQFLDDH